MGCPCVRVGAFDAVVNKDFCLCLPSALLCRAPLSATPRLEGIIEGVKGGAPLSMTQKKEEESQKSGKKINKKGS